MEFDLTFFAVAIPAVMFAGISKGGFGSGASFAAGAILALIVEPAVALGVLLPLLILIDMACMRPYWKRWSWAEAKPIILGSVPGVILGAVLYKGREPGCVSVPDWGGRDFICGVSGGPCARLD